MKSVRLPAVAGLFYTNSADELHNEINQYLENTLPCQIENPVRGLIAPHAGYVYSGQAAAQAYQTIRNAPYKTVVVVSPSHYEYFHGVCIYQGDAYRTPLGDIPVNKELRNQLTSSDQIIFSGTNGHGREHALEVHLPFLQTVLGDFDLLPIVMGDQSTAIIEQLAIALKQINQPEVLFVASSDLSHFYPREIATVLDGIVEEHINTYNYRQLTADLQKGRCEACGGGPIAAIMQALDVPGVSKAATLVRTDSGYISGDTTEVVGYLSAVITN